VKVVFSSDAECLLHECLIALPGDSPDTRRVQFFSSSESRLNLASILPDSPDLAGEKSPPVAAPVCSLRGMQRYLATHQGRIIRR
jgi:hypothetical protein